MKTVLLIAAFSLGQPQVAVKFHDGSQVFVSVEFIGVEVETKYGKLTIPFHELRSIEFGSHFAPGQEAQVKALLTALGTESSKEREAAQKLLQSHPAAYHLVVHAAMKSADLEIRQRAGKVVKAMQDDYRAERLKTSPDDVLVIDDGLRVTGRIVSGPIVCKSPHLGELKLQLHDLASVRVQSTEKDARTILAESGWQGVSIFVHRGEKLILSATGSVDLWAQGPGQYMVGPNGYNTVGSGSQWMAGALIGKVGDGPEFLVGENYSGRPPGEGRLWLRVVPSPWANSAMSGSFAVKARNE